MKGKRLWLNFDAINYKANIWLNGKQIGSADQVAGMYRMFEFDITRRRARPARRTRWRWK